MDVVHPRCCGLDIHKDLVVACAATSGPGGTARKEVRSFGATTEQVLALGDWLRSLEVTTVAMESTGVYWQPIWNLLEEHFTLLLVNPQHMKAVPGRKTDVKDSEWIADLLRHGLLHPSFVPDRPQREVRELTRYRSSLVDERTAEVNRLQKTLEGANIKLGSVASDVTGMSARQMLDGLVAGRTDAPALAQLARGRMRAHLSELEQALVGGFREHQRFLVARQLAHLDYLDELIAEVSAEIAERLRPFDEAIERLDAIPGVGRRIAETIVAEIGTDMSHFPSPQHLASWAGMCPGNDESAGKRRSGKTRKGNKALRRALIEAGHAAGRKKDTYLQAQYRRLTARRGKPKAAVAVGHSILGIVWYLLKYPERPFAELGAQYFDERDRTAVERRLIRRLEALGNRVTCEPVEAAA